MSYPVGQVAGLAGITVRTLHHYDEIGLLPPGERSPAGHRRYGEDDLDRLQQILFYRELGFPLDEVAVLLDDPDADPQDHLRRRHDLRGVPADAAEAMDVAEEHRRFISGAYYGCSHETHAGLGEMYVTDERFTATYEAIRPGLAVYLRDAMPANAVRRL
ncbi:MerR family transcriptional regulator [Streptomyces kronopolitis]|uniref:MerR family transcriptional regulator n=1 Tax=Streptomyces kronopolitis TaxID=1612435 RepID=UPI003D97C207